MVTGPRSPQLATIDDLADKEVLAQKTSSYWEHLQELNEWFKKENKPPVKLPGNGERGVATRYTGSTYMLKLLLERDADRSPHKSAFISAFIERRDLPALFESLARWLENSGFRPKHSLYDPLTGYGCRI